MTTTAPAIAQEQPASPSRGGGDIATDVATVLPLFLLYHLGVAGMPVRNAADWVTAELSELATSQSVAYWMVTALLGGTVVALLAVMGQRRAMSTERFVRVFLEGAFCAAAMRGFASWAVGALSLGAGSSGDWQTALVMSAGAGVYEELVFRLGLFGVGAFALRAMLGKGVLTGLPALALWGVACAVVFSAWHHIGPLGDPFDSRVFFFRVACGLFLTGVYAFRGFSTAVWTHFLYDVWVLLL